MKKLILNTLKNHYEAKIQLHKTNVEIFLENPTGVGDHPDVVETVSGEVMAIAEYEDALQALNKHFSGIPKI